MRAFVIAALSIAAIGLYMVSSEHPDSVAQNEFNLFIQKYGANYATDGEYQFRLEVFKQNLALIEEVAARNPEATFGVNMFADKTDEEKRQYRNRGKVYGNNLPDYGDKCIWDAKKSNGITSMDNSDWRELMGPARDQGSCGGCWAFSVSGVMEGSYALSQGQTKVTKRFSPQYLIDCDKSNSGCGGGFEAYAFKFLETHDICLDTDYPYTARQSASCKVSDNGCGTGIFSKTCHKIGEDDYSGVVAAMKMGPVDVAIDATDVTYYKKGVMTSCRNRGLDHAIMGVGYDAENNAAIIRNSWGADWGQEGNFYVKVDSHACGWDQDAHYVTF